MVVLIISTYAFVVFHQKGGNFSKSLLSLAQPLSYYFSQIKSSRLVSYIFWCVCVQLSQFSSVTQSCLTLCHPVDCIMPGLPVHHQLLELAQTHVHRVGDAIQPTHPVSHPLLLPSIFPSIRVFSNESVLCIRWPEYWSFSISPSNEYSGLISFRIDWFDLLAVQGTLTSLLQHHSSKVSILWHLGY